MTKTIESTGKPEFWDRVFRILDDTDLKPTPRLMLLVIMIHEGENKHAFPSQETIARRVGVSDRQVRTILKELSSRGFIVTELRPGTTSLSRVNWDKFGTHSGSQLPGSQKASPEVSFLPTPEFQFLPTPEVSFRTPRKSASDEHKENTKINSKKKEQEEFLLPDVLDEFRKTWNESGFATCRKLTKNRVAALKARLKDADWRENWRTAIAKIKASSFCRGESERGWKADVDWFLKPDTFTKIMEGKYDDSTGSDRRHSSDPTRVHGGQMQEPELFTIPEDEDEPEEFDEDNVPF